MRDHTSDFLERWRCPTPPSRPGAIWGAFLVPGPCGAELRILASDAVNPETLGWEHVSVSIGPGRRPPNWEEMCFCKKLFWRDDECVVQFHPPADAYVNNHVSCLHLWKSTRSDFPRPPEILIGVKSEGIVRDAKHAREIRRKYGLGS
jgi:hypothetical protein